MEPNNYHITSLRIMHWNANGIRNKISELKNILSQLKVDIILINETKLKSSTKFYVSGYRCIRKERDNDGNGGGVAILIKDDINFSQVLLNLESFEAVAIKLSNNLIIASVYNPPRVKIIKNYLKKLDKTGKKLLIYGDFNAKNSYWRCKSNNANGKVLLDFSISKMYDFLIPDGFTLYPYNKKHAPSTVDIGLSKNLTFKTDIDILDDLDSDHRPIIINLTGSSTIDCRFYTTPNYRLANWKLFRSDINSKIVINNKIKTKSDVDVGVSNLTNIINNAIKISIPLCKTGKQFKYQLPSEILDLIQTRNSLKKILQRTCNDNIRKIKNKLTNTINKKISKFNNNNWHEKLSKLEVKNNFLWKMAKAISNTQSNLIPALCDKNDKVTEDIEKANLIAKHYESVHRMTHDMSNAETTKLANTNVQELLNLPINSDEIVLSSPGEVFNAIRNVKPRKAPGLDGIQNIVLKNLPRNAIVQLNYYFQCFFKFGLLSLTVESCQCSAFS